MREVPGPGQIHCHSGFLRGRNHFIIADGTARLYHGRHPRRRQDFEPIGEWEKRVRGGHGFHGPLLITRERVGTLHG